MNYHFKTMTSFSDVLKDIKNKHGYTDEEIAKSSGLSRPYISQLVNGRKPSKLAVYQKLATGLDVPVSELINPDTYNPDKH